MKRRYFLKSTGLTTLSLYAGFNNFLLASPTTIREAITFLKERQSNIMLFPRPENGRALTRTPAGLSWFPAPGAKQYLLEIRKDEGRKIYEAITNEDPAHLPDEIMEPGKYQWNVFALNENGEKVAERGNQTFTISENSVQLPWQDPEELIANVSREHSRILYPKAMLPEIRKAIKGPRKKVWKTIYQQAEASLDKGAPEFPQYHKLSDEKERRLSYIDYFHYIRGYVDDALKNLSLAYLISEEERFARAAKVILLEVADWPTTDEDVTSLMADWGDEIGLSLAKYGHKAYDWLFHALTDAEKEKVFKMCRDRADQAYRLLKNDHNFITEPGRNHDSRTITFLGEMAIALAHESDEAAKWLDYSLKACTTVYPHWAGADGGWGNGMPYSIWYNDLYISPFMTVRNQTRFDLWKRPFFKNYGYFLFYCTTPKAEIGPFGDAAERTAPAAGSAGSFSSRMWFQANLYNDPYIGWWANQTPEIENISNEYALLYDTRLQEKKPDDIPQSRNFSGIGWAALHSNLADPENDNFMLFKSSPYGSVSHNHADQNAFAILKGGKALAIPSGYYGPGYGEAHHAQFNRATMANNTILVNGEGQKKRDKDASGEIVQFEDHKGFTYVAGDATKAYMGKLNKFVRHIILLRPSVFLMVDELEAPEPSQFQWLLHAFEAMEIEKNTILSKRDGQHLKVHLFSTEDLEITQTNEFAIPYNEGIPSQFQEEVENHWHVKAQTATTRNNLRIGAVMELSNSTENYPVTIRKHGNWIKVTGKGNSGNYESWLNLDPEGPIPSIIANEVSQKTTIFAGRDQNGLNFKY